MFFYEEFLGKAGAYFSRGADADESSDERTLWLLLGLEFLLRAPLARIHPTLLATPEGDSILHAAGVERARGVPRSIPTKSVIDRLTKIDPKFGEDRGKDAAFLTEIRNEELHSSSSALANLSRSVWMPRFLDVVEAICAHLEMEPSDLMDAELVEAAETYRATADAATQGEVRKLTRAANAFFDGLTDDEVVARRATVSGYPRIACPACKQPSAVLELSAPRTSAPGYDDEAQEITYQAIHVVNELNCSICGLSLSSTAQVVAAGVDRLYETEQAESRYEGWEAMMTYEDALTLIRDEEDYGND